MFFHRRSFFLPNATSSHSSLLFYQTFPTSDEVCSRGHFVVVFPVKIFSAETIIINHGFQFLFHWNQRKRGRIPPLAMYNLSSDVLSQSKIKSPINTVTVQWSKENTRLLIQNLTCWLQPVGLFLEALWHTDDVHLYSAVTPWWCTLVQRSLCATVACSVGQ